MTSMASATAPLPKLLFVPAGSITSPAGYAAPQAAVAPVAPSAPADPAVPAPGTPEATQAAAAGPAQAHHGASMIGRVLGVIPLLAGVTQLLVGLAITRGTLPMAGIPLIGGLPKFLIGGLVAATSTTSLMEGVGKLLGKTP